MTTTLEKAKSKSKSRAKSVGSKKPPAWESIKDILIENVPKSAMSELQNIRLSTVRMREAMREALRGSKFKFALNGQGVWRDRQREKDPVWNAILSKFINHEKWAEFVDRKNKWIMAVQKSGKDPYLKRIPSSREYLIDASRVACALLGNEEFRKAFEEGDFIKVLAMTIRFFFSTRLNIQLRLDVATSYDFVGYALSRAIMNYYRYALQKDFITLEELKKTLRMVAGAVYANPYDREKKKRGLIFWNKKGESLCLICGVDPKIYVEYSEGNKKHNKREWEDSDEDYYY